MSSLSSILHSAEYRQARGQRAGIDLLSAWMVGSGCLIAALMYYQGVQDWPLFTLNLLTVPLAGLAVWGVRRGHGHVVSVALVVFIWWATAYVHIEQSRHLPFSLMNIAVLTLFAGWAFRWRGTLIVIVLCQGLLALLALKGAYSLREVLPLMISSLFFGLVMMLGRRVYEVDTQHLMAALSEIAGHEKHQRMLSSIVEQSPYSVEVVDLEGRIIYANATYLKHMGYTEAEVLGRRSRDVSMNGLSQEAYQALQTLTRAGTAWHGMVRNRNKAGDTLIEQVLVTPIHDERGAVSYFVQAKQDVSERVYAQERIQQLMNYDKLTQLPNRFALLRKLEDMLQQERMRLGHEPSNQAPHRWHGLLLFDIDRFNQFNLARGSQWGDALLVAVAVRLQALQADQATMWVARYTNDQFAVVLEDVGSTYTQACEQAHAIAEQVQSALTSVTLSGVSEEVISLSLGVGTTVFPNSEPGLNADNSDRIARRATIALAHAKEHGLRQIYAYSAHLAEQAERYLQMEQDLRVALEQDQLRFYVQPQYDKNGHVVSMEALVRWQHPGLGMVSPGQFIPVAEASGMIEPLGEWMLLQAGALLTSPLMQQRGYSVSVNISARQFMRADFVEVIGRILAHTQAPPQRLVLEVTETMVLADIQEAIQTMKTLRALGVQFALDDFGTGYSSLSYLRQLPIDELKIDQSFIQGIEPEGSSAALVQAVLMVAKQLCLRVVAEGVESAADADLLQQWDPAILCQGYFYSKPMPLETWMQALHATPAHTPIGRL